MPAATYSESPWRAPAAAGPLDATVRLPGSKSLTNRELVLSALAEEPSRLRRPLAARDTALMADGLRAMGARIDRLGDDLVVTPGRSAGEARVDCGLAGTVMRFLPPLASVVTEGPVRFDGDPAARDRPMGTTLDALVRLGVEVDDGGRRRLPFTVRGRRPVGGPLEIDASGSSQFVSGLLLSAARFTQGLDLEHRGGPLPSLPHIAMTVAVITGRGVRVDADPAAGRWRVAPGPVAGRDVDIEPDLSNAAPFLAAALVAGGRVTVPGWPDPTTQAGDLLRGWLEAFGAEVHLEHGGLTVDGGGGVASGRALRPVDLDLGQGSELAPTLVGLAAFADGPSRFRGIAHMRGHETDRLAALAAELTALGASTTETDDGLIVEPGRLHASGRPWHTYADHRMATTGALVGLGVHGLDVEDVGTTAKTLPGFEALWAGLLR